MTRPHIKRPRTGYNQPKNLPESWTWLGDVFNEDNHCVACLFMTANGELRIQREGAEWQPIGGYAVLDYDFPLNIKVKLP